MSGSEQRCCCQFRTTGRRSAPREPKAIAANNARRADLALVGEVVRRVSGDGPAESEGTPLGVALSRMAEAEPDRLAVVDGTGSATRMELERRSNRLAR